MGELAALLSALASLAWPLIVAAFLFLLMEPIKQLVASAKARKFTIKVAGNELTMEEASELQRKIVSDLQTAVAGLEKRIGEAHADSKPAGRSTSTKGKRFLWVDDHPKNNSYLVAWLEERGASVNTALSTEKGVEKFRANHYDVVLSDMGRGEGADAGVDLVGRIRAIDQKTPVFIFCSSRAAAEFGEEARRAGANLVTSSSTELLRSVTAHNSGETK